MRILLRLLIPVAFLTVGVLGYRHLSQEQEQPRRPQPEPRVIRTQVVQLNEKNFRTTVVTQGVVRPHSEAALTTQVPGKVKTVSPKLHDGAFFSKGDTLLTLEDEDFAAAVTAARADLARAEATFAQEKARANQARLNWEDLGYDEQPNDLVLRVPQLREATANVEAAKAALERAKRDLQRTVLLAPFDGRVLTRSVSTGQSVTPSTVLATAFTTRFVEVRLPVSARDLAFLNLPESTTLPPLPITISDSLRPGIGHSWNAEIVGTEGSLDENSRELFAIARVQDPFSRNAPPGEEGPPLRIGQPVRAIIPGIILEDVMEVPRSAVRRLDRIYLVTPEMTLERHEIEPIWSDEERLVIRHPDIEDGALLATSKLVYAPNLAKVEIVPDDPDPESTDETSAAETAPPEKNPLAS